MNSDPSLLWAFIPFVLVILGCGGAFWWALNRNWAWTASFLGYKSTAGELVEMFNYVIDGRGWASQGFGNLTVTATYHGGESPSLSVKAEGEAMTGGFQVPLGSPEVPNALWFVAEKIASRITGFERDSTDEG